MYQKFWSKTSKSESKFFIGQWLSDPGPTQSVFYTLRGFSDYTSPAFTDASKAVSNKIIPTTQERDGSLNWHSFNGISDFSERNNILLILSTLTNLIDGANDEQPSIFEWFLDSLHSWVTILSDIESGLESPYPRVIL